MIKLENECTCESYLKGNFSSISNHYHKNKDSDDELYDIDFKNFEKEGFKGYIWTVATCKACGGKMVSGASYSDYRATGLEVIKSAYKTILGYRIYDNLTVIEVKEFLRECLKKHRRSRYIDLIDEL